MDKKKKLRSLQKDFIALQICKNMAENIAVFVARQKQIDRIFLNGNITHFVKIIDIEEKK